MPHRYGRVRISNSAIRDRRGREYLVQVGVSLDPMDAALSRYRDLLLWLLPSGAARSARCLVVAVGLCAASAHRVWPARRARSTCARWSGACPRAACDDELDDVATRIQRHAGAARASVGEMRQFSAALAHELRTPLAALRGEIELALRRSGRDAAEQRDAGQPDRRARSAGAPDRSDADAGSRRVGSDPSHVRARRRRRAGGVAGGAAGAGGAGAHDRFALRTQRHRAGERRRQLAAASAAEPARQRDQVHAARAASVVLRVSHEAGRARIDVRDTGIGMSPDVTPTSSSVSSRPTPPDRRATTAPASASVS